MFCSFIGRHCFMYLITVCFADLLIMHYFCIAFKNGWIFGRTRKHVVATFKPLNLCKNLKSRDYNQTNITNPMAQHNDG